MGRLFRRNSETLKLIFFTFFGIYANVKLLDYYDFKPIFHQEEYRYGSYFDTDFMNTEICQDKDRHLCVSGLKKHFSTIYVAPQYNLTACTIPKNMSTMMRAIMCFLMDPNAFGEEKEKFSDYYGDYRCPGLKQSDFHSYNAVKEVFPVFVPERGTMIALVRDPVERFVSGFIDKCYFENRCNECGKSLSCFLIEQYEKTMRSSRNLLDPVEDNYMTRHFFPQNWQCEFTNYLGNYSVIKYSSGKRKSDFYKDLKKVLSFAKVPESKVEFVLDRLKSEKTRHSTHQGFLKKMTKQVYKELYSSPYLMELLIRIYYQDFVLFGFEIPDLKAIYSKAQYRHE